MGFLSDIFGGGQGTSGIFGSHNAYTAQPVDLTKNQFDYNQAIQNAISLGGRYQDAQSGVNVQNQGYIDQLSKMFSGQGPSVAQDQLNINTQRNRKKAMAMAASQRGVNPALAAKMGIDAAAGINQDAAGQAALLRSQEILGAGNSLGSALNSQTNANLGMAGLAAQLGNVFGGLQNQQNATNVTNQLGAQQINATGAQQNAQYGQKMTGGLLGGLTGGLAKFAGGGEVAVNPNPFGMLSVAPIQDINLPKPSLSYGLDNAFDFSGGEKKDMGFEEKVLTSPMAKGIRALMGDPTAAVPIQQAGGGEVPGEAQHPGNDMRNDVVPALLSKGEIVIPNSITQSEDPGQKAKSFVEAIQASHKPTEKISYQDVLNHHKKMQEIMLMMCGGKA